MTNDSYIEGTLVFSKTLRRSIPSTKNKLLKPFFFRNRLKKKSKFLTSKMIKKKVYSAELIKDYVVGSIKRFLIKQINSFLAQAWPLVKKNFVSLSVPKNKNKFRQLPDLTKELFKNITFFKKTLFSNLIIKYLLFSTDVTARSSLKTLASLMDSFYFSHRVNFFKKLNLISVNAFNFSIQKKFLQHTDTSKFRPNVSC